MPTRDPIEMVLRNFLTMRRIENTLGAAAGGILEELFGEILAVIARHDPTAVSALRYRRGRIETILDQVRGLNRDAYAELERVMASGVARAGVQQSETAAAILRASIGQAAEVRTQGLGLDFMRVVVERNPFDGATLKEWARRQRDDNLFRIRRELQRGLLEEETIADLVGRIRGQSVGSGYARGIMGKAEREATSLARTAVNDISSTALWETYRANPGITKAYQIVATLDARTTPVCRALDGQTFAYDADDAPRPPFHWGCRTTLVAVIDWKGLGLNPDVDSTRAARDLESGRSTQVDGSIDYEGWLRQQTRDKQREILGPSRAELFREGASLRDMVIRENGVFRELTLEELRRAA